MSDWEDDEPLPVSSTRPTDTTSFAGNRGPRGGSYAPRGESRGGGRGSLGGRFNSSSSADWDNGGGGSGGQRGFRGGGGYQGQSRDQGEYEGHSSSGRGGGSRGGYGESNGYADRGLQSNGFGGQSRGGTSRNSSNNGWDDDVANGYQGYSGGRGGGSSRGRGSSTSNGWGREENNGTSFGSRSGGYTSKMSDQVDDWEDDEPRQNGTNRRGDDYNRNDRGSYGNTSNGGYDGGRSRGGSGYAPRGRGDRSGGFASDAGDSRSQGPLTCYSCKGQGHMSRDCPEGGGQNCFKCQEPGHMARDCTNPGGNSFGRGRGGFDRDGRGGGGGRGGGSSQDGCFKCGEHGHFSRECPSGGDRQDRPRGQVAAYIPQEETEEELFHHGVSSGINFERYEHVKATVTGQNAPERIETFKESGLRKILMDNIQRSGYTNPTPVQKNAFPIIMEGRDLMACAQTGSGKTAAFLLPILHKLLEDGFEESVSGQTQHPLAVIVAPTRELAIQIKDEARKFASGTAIRCMVVYGGTEVNYQRNELRRGVHVLVATPGRLLAFVDENQISFSKLRFLILDEADRMLDMGFMPDIERLEHHISMPVKGKRQTLMFSATFPDEIQNAATSFLSDYLYLQIGLLGSACGDVKQLILPVTQYDKREKVVSILNDVEKVDKTLIFVEQKKAADFLATYLCQSEFMTTSVHSDRTQQQREEAVNDFKRGKALILVATAVAARGLDIPHVSHVINYDLPKTIDEYVHRIGRTGRVGNVGKATSFYDEKVDRSLAADLIRVLAEVEQEVPKWLEEEGHKSFPSSGGGFGRRNHDIRHRGASSPAAEVAHQVSIQDEDEMWD